MPQDEPVIGNVIGKNERKAGFQVSDLQISGDRLFCLSFAYCRVRSGRVVLLQFGQQQMIEDKSLRTGCKLQGSRPLVECNISHCLNMEKHLYNTYNGYMHSKETEY